MKQARFDFGSYSLCILDVIYGEHQDQKRTITDEELDQLLGL
jgi:hypothetical protein